MENFNRIKFLEKIGIKNETINKYLEDNGKEKLENLRPEDFIEIITVFLKEQREKMLKMKDEIIASQEKLKEKKEKLEKAKKEFEENEKKKILENLKKLEVKKENELKVEFDKKRMEFDMTLLKEKEEFFKNIKVEFNKEIKKITKKQVELENQEKELIQKKEFLEQKIKTFESEKKKELDKLSETLKLKEEEFLNKLEKERIKKLEEINKEIRNIYENKYKELKEAEENIHKTKAKLMKTERNLNQKEKELLNKENLFNQEIKTFNALKQEEINKLKENLKLQEEEFFHNLKEKEVNKIEEINKKIKTMYKNKENELQDKENELNKKEIALNIKEKKLNNKNSELQEREKNIDNEVKTLIKEKIKSYENKITILEEEINILREERDDLSEELNGLERNKDKDIIKELESKRKELQELKNFHSKILEDKNNEIEAIKETLNEFKKNKRILLQENEILRSDNEEVERIKSKNRILKDKLEELDSIRSERDNLMRKLESIYSTGKEKELRIKDIQKEPLYKNRLKLENDINDELDWLKNIEEKMSEYGVKYPKRLLYAFHTALKSNSFSPLTVLSGVSGTGKSELPKLYSYFGGFNFLAEAVQPNWDSPESMMGYYNTIENKFDATNILRFLIQTSLSKNEYEYGYKEAMNMILLDEMNLAHIELYFAEFLSKFEQKRGNKDIFIDIKLGAGQIYNILLDNNLLWIGTMNEDETTKSLSDKVLDRSFLINFPRPKKLLSRNRLIKLNDISDFKYLKRETWNNWLQKESVFKTEEQEKIINKYKNITNDINEILSVTGRAIGHRVWQSMEFYINNHPKVIKNQENLENLEKYTKLAFEEQLVQKIMPKLRGIETHGKEKNVLNDIKALLNDRNFKIVEDFENAMNNPYRQFIWNSAEYLEEN